MEENKITQRKRSKSRTLLFYCQIVKKKNWKSSKIYGLIVAIEIRVKLKKIAILLASREKSTSTERKKSIGLKVDRAQEKLKCYS